MPSPIPTPGHLFAASTGCPSRPLAMPLPGRPIESLLADSKMARSDSHMDTSVTQFRANCPELIRRAEAGAEPVDIKRRGKVIARLTPAPKAGKAAPKAWEALRGSGELKAEPEESVIDEAEFEASV